MMREKGLARISIYRNLWLIYNPQSGILRRQMDQVLSATGAELKAQGHVVRYAATEGPGHATELGREAVRDGADLVLVLGGDGTINETVAGVACSVVPVGILPGGTANVLCMEMGMGRRIAPAVRMIPDAQPVRITLGEATFGRTGDKRLFVCMLGAGLDAQVVEAVDPQFKARLGKVAYWVAAWSRVTKSVPIFSAKVDQRVIETSFLLASRVKNYGGDLEICRSADLLSDRLEVAAFAGSYAVEYVKYFFGIVSGTLDRIPGAVLLPAQELELLPREGERVLVQVDGELAGELPVKVRTAPDALTMLMPRQFLSRSSAWAEEQEEKESQGIRTGKPE